MAVKDDSKLMLPLHLSINHALRTHRMRMNGEKPAVCWIVSPPGAGKTEMIHQAAQENGIGFLAYEPGLERPEKFGGIPEINRYVVTGKSSYASIEVPVHITGQKRTEKNVDTKQVLIPVGQELRTEWSVPQLICEVRALAREYSEKGVIVLLDDWHLCTEDVQAIAFELFTHYSLNGHKVPDNVTFVLAGNDSTAAGARLQFSAVRNRCMLLPSFPDPEYWLSRYAIPRNLNNVILGFFSNAANQQYLHEEESTTEQFGSPRSWTNISLHLNDIDSHESGGLSSIKDKTLRVLFEGCVSKKAAQELMMYYKVYSKIDVKKLFDKGIVDIPEDPIQRFAYGAAISHELYSRKCKDLASGSKKQQQYTKNFSKALRTLLNKNEEIAMKCIIQIAMRVENKDKGLYSGIGILNDMAGNQELDSDVLSKLPEVSNVMSLGSGV